MGNAESMGIGNAQSMAMAGSGTAAANTLAAGGGWLQLAHNYVNLTIITINPLHLI